jgi:signal transduction histidine kinase
MTSPPITERTILKILIAGFALVMVLLVVAGVVGARGARTLERDASRLVHQQLLTARLINEIEIEQATINAIFYRLIRASEPEDRDSLLADLDATDQDFARIAQSASGTPEAQLWAGLLEAARAFAAEARAVIRQERASGASMRRLFTLHDRVLHRVADLLAASSAGARELDVRIAAQARKTVHDSLVLLGSCLLLALVCSVMTVRMTAASFRKMESQASELSRVSWHMLEGQEAAARRFSHELHDELGQTLAALKANLLSITPENLAAKQSDCLALTGEAISNVRELSQLLRPVILDDFGLDAALRWLAEKFSERTRIRIRYESNFQGRLREQTETHLFRIAQEALTNVARHSGATEVDLSLMRTAREIRLRIADNGRGVPEVARGPERQGGLGLIGMKARARHAGGTLLLSSGNGFTVEVAIPVAGSPDGSEPQDPNPAS